MKNFTLKPYALMIINSLILENFFNNIRRGSYVY